MTDDTVPQSMDDAKGEFRPSFPSSSASSLSSAPGVFPKSIEPAGMLARLKRAVTGRGVRTGTDTLAPAGSGLCPLADVKKQLSMVLNDCRDDAVRLRIDGRIASAASVTELWQLRCDIYQCVAHERGQGEASRRINSLLPVFKGWIPAGQLASV